LKRHDPTLLCVVTLTEERALREAARADEEIGAGNYRGPLHGIPYGIKDVFAARGYPTTWGSAPFRDQVIDVDSTAVKKLEEAGAVLIAKLSTGELALGDTWFGGQTRNPWDPTQGSIGSSAGPASATAAGLVAFSVGTETVGSIVAPSTACRVTGLRPTFGTISRAGAMTLSWSMDNVGPICRSVEDCALVFDALRGRDHLDATVVDAPFNFDPDLDLTQVVVGYHSNVVDLAIRERLSGLVGESQLVEFVLPANRVDVTLIINAEAGAAFEEFQRIGADALLDNREWGNILRSSRAIPAVEYLQAQRWRQQLIQDMAARMQEVDVFVAWVSDPRRSDVVDITNLTGQPCVVIPHGDGTSLSFIGRPFEEVTVLALAMAYQDATSYHTERPPAYLD
jgi:Asp-tRNA(Asn)/Glu-tRNA(Gln) amidotransferase A subunit family amidase